MRSRLIVILIGLLALWATLVGRAAWLQVLPNQRLSALERRQFQTVVELRSRRGDVVDRNGHELAASVAAYSLYADPKLVEDPRAVARALASELGMPAKQILAKLKDRKRRFVWIQRWLDQVEREGIEAKLAPLKERGVGFLDESRRIYPNDRLLAHSLGFVGSDGAGLEGLEARYQDELQGASRRVNLRKDARGRPLIVNGRVFAEAPDGADLVLTVDRELQFTLEQELRATVDAQHADSAVGVVLDALTSEILAIASAPTFDPNRPSQFSADARRNRAVVDAFEPGSTMKTFVIAGALERKLIEPNTKFDCQGGQMRVGDRVVREADQKHKFGSLTAAEILAVSSNIGAAKIGMLLGAQALRDTLEGFGFGARTGVDLPAEAKGMLLPPPWRDHLAATVSFGHGVSVTALQMANAYAAVANGGWLKQPYLVKSIRDKETGEVVETKPRTIRRAISEDHAATLRLMLTAVTGPDGTGTNARVSGFPVAGKTGTAQKVNPNGRGYLPNAYVSSFAGFLPANDPKFVIYVAVDNPKRDYYGSQVAAPVFARVAKFAVRRAALSPVLFTGDNLVPRTKDEQPLRVRPTLAEFDPQEAPAAPVSADAPIVAAPAPTSWETMPNLRGLSVREVLARTAGADVAIQIRGRGYVARTSPEAGAKLDAMKQGGRARPVTVFLSNDVDDEPVVQK